MARYWSDEAYSQFYERSSAEQGLVNRPSSTAGSAGAGGEPTRRQLEDFQQAFAEWSEGRGGLRATDFRRLLMQVGADLSQAQARCLWNDVAADDGVQRLNYDQALSAYRQVLGAPVQFKAPPGSAPPGRKLPSSFGALSSSRRAHEEAKRLHRNAHADVDEERHRRLAPRQAERGLGLSHGEVRELLLAEGIPHGSVAELLDRFAEAPEIPQAVLFDFLSDQAGAPGEPDAAPADAAPR